jgi:hypothetical protein
MVLWLFPSSVGVLMLVYSFDLTDDAKLFSNYNLLFCSFRKLLLSHCGDVSFANDFACKDTLE